MGAEGRLEPGAHAEQTGHSIGLPEEPCPEHSHAVPLTLSVCGIVPERPRGVHCGRRAHRQPPWGSPLPTAVWGAAPAHTPALTAPSARPLLDRADTELLEPCRSRLVASRPFDPERPTWNSLRA